MVKWNLGDIISSLDDKSLKKYISNIEKEVKKFESYRSRLRKDISPKDVVEILEHSEKMGALSGRLSAYIGLKLSEDTSSHKYNALGSKLDQLGADWGNRTMFFGLWWKSLDEQNAKRILEGVGNYKHHLKSSRKFKKYMLKENEEKIINIKDVTGAGAISNIYDIITNAYTFDFKNKKGLSQAEIVEKVRDKDPANRKLAYDTVLGRYHKEESVLGEIYRNIVLDWSNEGLKLRKYKSSISIRNLGNDLTDESIEALLNVCKKNVNIFQDYFKLKAKIIGMKKLRRYDIYAPIKGSKKKIGYPEAVKTVLGVFDKFDSGFANLARKVIDEKHIHSEIQKGKRSGAFCYSITPSITPYVLLNYVGSYNDVSTLAHELGHAVHSLLARKNNLFDFHAPIPLAETASIFSEMLLEEKLLASGLSKNERINLLATQLDGIYASVIRQAYFVIFEKKAHEMIEHGATIGEMNKTYFDTLKEQFGNAVSLPKVFEHEWKYIPHIYHTPFYCYGYAFGNLLVLSLFNMYKQEGNSFIPKYLKILSYGGGEVPEKILNEVGINIRDEKFWQGGFNLVRELVENLKTELKTK
jgi:oligoendopeptidase F